MSINNTQTAHDPLLWLRGNRAALGPFARELVEDYWRWAQDPRVIIGPGRQTPESLEARIAGYEAQARSMANQTRFTVYDLPLTMRPARWEPPRCASTTTCAPPST